MQDTVSEIKDSMIKDGDELYKRDSSKVSSAGSSERRDSNTD
jgi:hypothetical protein